MSNGWFECVCQFLQAQSESLGSVLQTLGNQNTISDIGGTDTLQLPEQASPFAAATPMHLFMLFLAMIWAWMFIFSKNKEMTKKPAAVNNNGSGGGGEGANDGGNGGDHGGAGLAS